MFITVRNLQIFVSGSVEGKKRCELLVCAFYLAVLNSNYS